MLSPAFEQCLDNDWRSQEDAGKQAKRAVGDSLVKELKDLASGIEFLMNPSAQLSKLFAVALVRIDLSVSGDLVAGMVRHKLFGVGWVKEFIEMGENSVVIVQFNSGQTKSLMLKYANLLKLNT